MSGGRLLICPPFPLKSDPSFFLNDPSAVLLLPSLQTPPSRPFSNLTFALLHVCLVQGPPSSIALVSGSTAYNGSHCPSFQTRSVAPPRLESSLRKGKLRPKPMDNIGMMNHRTSARMKKNHVGGGMPGSVTLRGGGGRNAETGCRRISVGEALTGFR